MPIHIIFETHSTTEDNESGIASGWKDCTLSEQGRLQAVELGKRRRNDGIQAVFTSDLRRAIDTAQIAFAGTSIPIFYDWRLRECDFGDRNGLSAATVHNLRVHYLDQPYPNGESWRQAAQRVGRFLEDLPLYWNGKRVLVIGHRATHFGLDHHLKGLSLEGLLVAKFVWQEGWEYRLVKEQDSSYETCSSEPLDTEVK